MRSSWMDHMVKKKDCGFHKDNILLDPYARAVTGAETLGRAPGRWKRLCMLPG